MATLSYYLLRGVKVCRALAHIKAQKSNVPQSKSRTMVSSAGHHQIHVAVVSSQLHTWPRH
jgi:hypothetical protein